jgi:hypothetical protein
MVDISKAPDTTLALANATGKIELVEDTLILNEEFKKNVAIPYFKDIFRDLVTQSDNKHKINKITILSVSKKRLIHLSRHIIKNFLIFA